MLLLRYTAFLLLAVIPTNQQDLESDELAIYAPIIAQVSSKGVNTNKDIHIDRRALTWWDTTRSLGTQWLIFERALDTHVIELLKSSNRIAGIALPIIKPTIPANEARCVADKDMVVLSFTSPCFIKEDSVEVGVLLHTQLQRPYRPPSSGLSQHYGFFSLTIYTLAKKGPDWIVVNTRIILQS